MVMWGRNSEPRNAPYVANYDADFDPLTTGKVNPEFSVPDPDPTNGGYVTEFGWAARFSNEDNLPDKMRLGQERVIQPIGVDQDEWFDEYREPDRDARNAVVYTNPDPEARTFRGSSGKAVTDSPYRPGWPEPNRPTMGTNPNPWNFTRPFDQTPSRHMTGEHFSMAGHRRDYPIYGMKPVGLARNTYRIDPTPWDVNVVDSPSNSAGYDTGVNRASDWSPEEYGSRSFRLGV